VGYGIGYATGLIIVTSGIGFAGCATLDALFLLRP
jgi:hypothetical protein